MVNMRMYFSLKFFLIFLSISTILFIILNFTFLTNCPKRNVGFSQICQKPFECIPPFRAFEKRFRVVPKYRLNFCAIEKNLSTVMTAIFCFLFDEQKFREGKRRINTETFARRLCKDKNEVFSIGVLMAKFNQTANPLKWLHLVVVRDPLERFLSGFVDKCVLGRTWLDYPERCNGCRNNLSCFLHIQFQRMRQFAFEGKELNSFDDRHFFPQNWRCQFNEHFRHFTFIPYSSTPQGVAHFYSTFFDLLADRGVPKGAIKFIQNQTSLTRTKHSTWHRKQRQKGEQLLRSNPLLMDIFIRMYFYDFILFGYPIPSIL